MYYADYEESVNAYCVFHTESNFCFSSYASEEEAEEDVNERNQSVL